MVKRPSQHVIDTAVENVDPARLHSIRETASLINLSAEYLRDLINIGRVDAFKPFDGHFRIPGNEVRRILRSMLTDGTVPS
jgi:hypothetical protein